MTGLSVSGGSGGVRANVEDMRRTADMLDATNDALGRTAGRARGAAVSGPLIRTAIFSPATAARAQAELVQAAASITALTIQIEARVLVLRTRADLFILADAGAVILDRAADIASMPAFAAELAAEAVVAFTATFGAQGGDLTLDILRGEVAPDQVDDRVLGALKASGAAAGDAARRVLAAHPEVTEVATGGLPFVVSAASGGRLPSDFEDFLGVVQSIAGVGGYLRDRPPAVVLHKRTRESAPTGLKDVMKAAGVLWANSKPDSERLRIRVQKIESPGQTTRWIVGLPGIQEWDPTAGGDPGDLTTAWSAMQGRGGMLKAIRDALEASGLQRGQRDPVLVSGHSLGGIVAAALSADPATRQAYNITHVVTAGSPVSRMPIPQDVHVMSMEHWEDPVPRLDGQDNPDRPNWTTVTRDVAGDPHGTNNYVETARQVDSDRDTPLSADRASFEPFFHGTATTSEYDLSRG